MNHTDWEGRWVLVTGGAGFLGSRLAEVLVWRGAKVTCWDYIETPARLQGVRDAIEYRQVDISDGGLVSGKEQSFEVLFHLAAFAMPAEAQKQPDLAYRQNVTGTVHMLQIARQSKVKKFVFMSAGALYTNIPKYIPIDEKHPIDPCQSVYATTKRIGELLCEDFIKTYGVPCIYFRLFNTYGPRQSEDYLIPSFVREARQGKDLSVLNEDVKRDFNYVDDIVEALILGAGSDFTGGPINLGSNTERSIGDVARLIAGHFGVCVSNLGQEVFGPKRQFCDNSLAQRVLGWRPTVSLEEGIGRTIKAALAPAVAGKR